MRLIDADRMREDWLENGENEYVYDTNAVLENIDAQPTAYDIDKVVEQLECAIGTVCGHKDNENNCGGCAGCTECKMEDAYRHAIEIVKGGAV